MRHIFLMFCLISPAWADDNNVEFNADEYAAKYLDTSPTTPIIPTGPSLEDVYIAPATGNVYIPIAPNVVIDTRTGQAIPVH